MEILRIILFVLLWISVVAVAICLIPMIYLSEMRRYPRCVCGCVDVCGCACELSDAWVVDVHLDCVDCGCETIVNADAQWFCWLFM